MSTAGELLAWHFNSNESELERVREERNRSVRNVQRADERIAFLIAENVGIQEAQSKLASTEGFIPTRMQMVPIEPSKPKFTFTQDKVESKEFVMDEEKAQGLEASR